LTTFNQYDIMKEQEELIDEVEEDDAASNENKEKETPEFSEDLVHGI
jgi:hypothetical protein